MTKTTKTTPSTVARVHQAGEMQTINEATHSDASTAPASVLALATAAAHVRGRKSAAATTVPPSHRRSQTIVAAGDLEMELLQKHKAVEELHCELESTSKALEESQEEAQLAARIGQTLLQRNQEMGAEIESKAIELQNRAESAEQVVAVLERKLSLAIAQIRALDMARTRAAVEAEQLTQELEDSRTRVQSLQGEVARSYDTIQRLQLGKARAEQALEARESLVAALEAAQLKLQAELGAKSDRIEVLASVERYNVEHISRLEIENQSICQQQHVLARREKQLQFENDAIASKMAAQSGVLKDCQARGHELENAIVGLHHEMEDLRDALHVEQTRVAELTRDNQELEARLDRLRRVRDHGSDDDEPSTQMLRNGSLFHELSRQLREEMLAARSSQQFKSGGAAKEPLSPEAVAGCLDSPARSSTRTSRNASSNNTDSASENDELCESTTNTDTEEVTPRAASPTRPPPLQLLRRRSQQDEAAESLTLVVAATSPRVARGDQREEGEEDDADLCLLKEFFVLTAAAVKIAGGGLRNDACNIHNEDLFAEAMAQGVTFDQFHKWLERRLEDDLEISLSPKRPTPQTATPPPPPARRSSIVSFWSR